MSSPPPLPRVYVVDDDPNLRDGVVDLLSDAAYEARAFESGDALLDAYPKLLPGCIVADLAMPGMSGLELHRRLLAAGCRWPVIMLTGQGNRPTAARAMEAGIIAFLEKPVREVELLAALMKGQAYLLGHAEMIPNPDAARRIARLTAREKQVLEFVLQQKLNKQVAGMLGIGETTVKGYRRSLMKKLGARNTMELVVFALRAGLYHPPKF